MGRDWYSLLKIFYSAVPQGGQLANPTGLLGVSDEDPDPIPSTPLDQKYLPPVRDPIDLHLKHRGVIL